ncbi:hypothetical protein EV644_12653 [Kribbella orskensis]|uniref:Uncharacterized protein n=1 Tax=Kribbella orskensis TaxID=2512216 RepID=A0ABY2B9Z0_9ACTN|nr:hypothetical protein EV642_12947 [Kribbella sp. VKM Ac-2500]TCO12310.1 hypothetical protein EV644_12653 [Kribbella orskensis]
MDRAAGKERAGLSAVRIGRYLWGLWLVVLGVLLLRRVNVAPLS